MSNITQLTLISTDNYTQKSETKVETKKNQSSHCLLSEFKEKKTKGYNYDPFQQKTLYKPPRIFLKDVDDYDLENASIYLRRILDEAKNSKD